jgi:hypothetical protein
MTGGLADVDAMVAVSGMARDPFVFFVERLHGLPGERDPSRPCSSLAWAGSPVCSGPPPVK